MKKILTLVLGLGLCFGAVAQESNESNETLTPTVETSQGEAPMEVTPPVKPIRNTNPDFLIDETESTTTTTMDDVQVEATTSDFAQRGPEKVITHEAVATTKDDGNIIFKFEGKTSATLVGIVKDSRTFNPIAGATVTAGDQTAFTNEHGRFKLGGFEIAETEVTVDTDGYFAQSHVVSIKGRSSALMVFKLENENQEVIEISEEDLLKIKLAPTNSTVKAGRQFFCFFEAPDGFEREAWIGISKKESAHDVADPENSDGVYMFKYLLHKVQGDLLFKAPDNPGNYEIRMYNKRENGKMVSSHVLKVISQ